MGFTHRLTATLRYGYMRTRQDPPKDFLTRNFPDTNVRHESEGIRKTSTFNQAEVKITYSIFSGKLRRLHCEIGNCVACDGPATIASAVTVARTSLFEVTSPETQVRPC